VRGHPCQLPEMLVERLIRLTTERNDLVLDPFVGTGTTTAVANRLKRRYVGIDIDKYYVDIAKRRLRLSDEKELHLLFDDVHEKISDSVFFESSKKTLTKKYIQETLKELAIHIGRLPKPEDLASSNLEFTKEEVLSKFENWKDAIYAAKIYFKNKNEN
jgi:site-specific DNA-methyltransferase (adenine-specific)